jgi:hypothetical protein
MTDAGEIGFLHGKGHERAGALLTDEQCAIPAFFVRTDQKRSAFTFEQHVATAFPQQR